MATTTVTNNNNTLTGSLPVGANSNNMTMGSPVLADSKKTTLTDSKKTLTEEDAEIDADGTIPEKEKKEKKQGIRWAKFLDQVIRYTILLFVSLWVAFNFTYFFEHGDPDAISQQFKAEWAEQSSDWIVIKYLKKLYVDSINTNYEYFLVPFSEFSQKYMNEHGLFFMVMLVSLFLGRYALYLLFFICAATVFFQLMVKTFMNLFFEGERSIFFFYGILKFPYGFFWFLLLALTNGFFFINIGMGVRLFMDWIRILFMSILTIPSVDFTEADNALSQFKQLMFGKFNLVMQGIYDYKVFISFVLWLILVGTALSATLNDMAGKGIIIGGLMIIMAALGFIIKKKLFSEEAAIPGF